MYKERQMKRQIVKTNDGSVSIYLEEMDEHYHSKHGAIAESEHIFVKNGLEASRQTNKLIIFEVGMGTGLNVLTSYLTAQHLQKEVLFHTIEAFPVELNEVEQLNYTEELGLDRALLDELHNSNWNEKLRLSKYFSVVKHKEKLQDFNLEKLELGSRNGVDVIYFDAFAPEKQTEMWSEEIFMKLFNALNKDGILVTYCVKGEIRRRLQKVGFEVEKLKGPVGGKREMCRAWKR